MYCALNALCSRRRFVSDAPYLTTSGASYQNKVIAWIASCPELTTTAYQTIIGPQRGGLDSQATQTQILARKFAQLET